MLVRRNHGLLIAWLILIGMFTRSVGTEFGVPFLFFNPEYLGKTGFLSFFLLGLAFGGFLITFHITSYLLNGYRYPFIARVPRPFMKYTINNSLLPALVILLLISQIIHFQVYNEFQSFMVVLLDIAGLLSGIIVILILSFTYFFSTNEDVFSMFDKKIKFRKLPQDFHIDEITPVNKTKTKESNSLSRVDNYFDTGFRLRRAWVEKDITIEMLGSVFKQNHYNAAMFQIIGFVILFILGLFRDYPTFQIPAAASIFLLISIALMIYGAIRFWFGNWTTVAIIALLLIANFVTELDLFSYKNEAFGLNYESEKVEYRPSDFSTETDSINYVSDHLFLTSVLEKWKKKVHAKGATKPKLIIINSSGGGLRSALWTMRVMQYCDSLYGGNIIFSSSLMTGSSGGIIGGTYYRELYIRHLSDSTIDYRNPKYFQALSGDLLNPIAFSITVSDLFLNLVKFNDGAYSYPKDRAYAFEKQLNINTGNILSGRIGDYHHFESEAIAPILLLAPTILNDGRRMVISSLPISCLLNHAESGKKFQKVRDGIEFSRLFARQDAPNLRLTSALRMNATFPYILPNVSLPTIPEIDVMDAGVRDNFGTRLSIRFLFAFREWIHENTDGVIVLQIRDTEANSKIDIDSRTSIIENFTSPVASIYGNLESTQTYNHDELWQYTSAWYDGKLDLVSFQLPSVKEKLSLNWHLTSKEKKYIYNAVYLNDNQIAARKLGELSGNTGAADK